MNGNLRPFVIGRIRPGDETRLVVLADEVQVQDVPANWRIFKDSGIFEMLIDIDDTDDEVYCREIWRQQIRRLR